MDEWMNEWGIPRWIEKRKKNGDHIVRICKYSRAAHLHNWALIGRCQRRLRDRKSGGISSKMK